MLLPLAHSLSNRCQRHAQNSQNLTDPIRRQYYVLTQNKNIKRAAIQLQHELNLVSKFFHYWCIKVNSSKIISIIFGHTHTTYIPLLQTNNHTINWSNYINTSTSPSGVELNLINTSTT